MKQNGVVASQDSRSYSLYFGLNIWFRARKVTGTFEKRAPGASPELYQFARESFGISCFRGSCMREYDLILL